MLFLSILILSGFSGSLSAQNAVKIVSVNGTVSEILAGIGMEANIVGTDITSNYPQTLKSKPKLAIIAVFLQRESWPCNRIL